MQRNPILCVIPAVLQYLDLCYQKCDKISTSAYSNGRFFVFFALGAFCACFVVVFYIFFGYIQLSLENAAESVNFKLKHDFCFPCVFCSKNMASYAGFLLLGLVIQFFYFFSHGTAERKERDSFSRLSLHFHLHFHLHFYKIQKTLFASSRPSALAQSSENNYNFR